MNAKERVHSRINSRLAGILGSALIFLSGCNDPTTIAFNFNCDLKVKPNPNELIVVDFQDKNVISVDTVQLQRNGDSLSIINPSSTNNVVVDKDGFLVFGRSSSIYTSTLKASVKSNDALDLDIQASCK
jgi:hypothetical protein